MGQAARITEQETHCAHQRGSLRMPPSASMRVPTSAQLPIRRRSSPLKRRTCCSSAPPATAPLAEVTHAPSRTNRVLRPGCLLSTHPLQIHRQLSHRGCAAHVKQRAQQAEWHWPAGVDQAAHTAGTKRTNLNSGKAVPNCSGCNQFEHGQGLAPCC